MKSLRISYAIVFILGFLTHLLITKHGTISLTRPPLKHQQLTPSLKPIQQSRFCDDQQTKCVFDIGHNTGQDTWNYLTDRNKNIRVLAVDANPVLMQSSSERFKEQILSNRLKLLTTGLTGKKSENGELLFYTNTANDKFSSFNEKLGCRDGQSRYQPANTFKYCSKSIIATTTCASLVKEFGIPIYVKIDIEGFDRICLASILNELDDFELPQYVSIENVDEIQINDLMRKGYNRFKAVNQFELQKGLNSSQKGWSGPWGEDSIDYLSGQTWVSGKEMINRLPLSTNFKDKHGKKRNIWYDLHAERSSLHT